jgi:2,4-dienoyl-CoA reductase-like NADH-dependent reductase (Old Yellow Enzyme family)
MSKLFSCFKLRGLEFRNRIFVSPMCQYSAKDGMADAWHLVHLGSRAVGGAGLVMVEAAAVVPEGRISPYDIGLWSDSYAEALAPIARFIREQGAVPAIQLAHAGRKASTDAPWLSRSVLGAEQGGWEVVAPSAIPFAPGAPLPRELAEAELGGIVTNFGDAAKHCLAAGFQVAEIHMAHGYLLTNFCRRSATVATMPTVAAWKIVPACRYRWCGRYARFGRRTCRCSCASPRQTGWRADGIWLSRCNFAIG